jgi:hypothetical protein
MVAVEMFPEPPERYVRVVLTDGRHLEGELHQWRGAFFVGPVVFKASEIETLEDVT